jgi:hypothetical protein
MSLIAGNLGFVQRLLDTSGLSWGVCAGAAAHIYGDRRPIQDVDILVQPGQLSQVVQLLQGAQKAVQFDGQRILWRGIKVFDDLTVRQRGAVYAYTLDAPMVSHLRVLPLLGARVGVLAPEDVLIHKLLMGRGAEQGKHDNADAAGIVRRQTFDSVYLVERLRLTGAGAGMVAKLKELGVEVEL